MGFIWDVIQQGQISDASSRAASLEHRVVQLEEDLYRTNKALMSLLKELEKRFGEDLNGDGRVG
jgi:hypothetical protein